MVGECENCGRGTGGPEGARVIPKEPATGRLRPGVGEAAHLWGLSPGPSPRATGGEQAVPGPQEGWGRAACAHRHDLVLLLIAVLRQDGQDGRGQQDALQHVDHTIGGQHVHSP